MTDRLTARLSSRFLSYGLPLIYLLTSIAFYLHTYDSAQVKITIVQMLGTVLISFWYLNLFSDQDRRWTSYWPVTVLLLASLASGLISFLHAAYRGPSLDECLRRVFYIHFALIAIKEICTLERLKRITFFLLIATAIATIYGLIQFLDSRFFQQPTPGIDPFVWRQAFSARIFSTFGNPNFFGNFLVIVTPVTLALLLKRHSEQPGEVLLFAVFTLLISTLLWKLPIVLALVHGESWYSFVFWAIMIPFSLWSILRYSFLGILLFLITLCNSATESKGAWIGYAAGFVSFLMLVLFYFSQFRSEKVRRTILQAATITMVVCTIAVTVYSRARTDSLRFRVCTWVSTWEMAQMHPIWGNGIGSFRILYPAFRRPQIFHIEGKHNTETDHAEDEYWEVLQDEGVLGFGIFIWVIITFSLLGVRSLGRFTEGLWVRDPASGKRKASDDPRAFYMLGYLSAFWGMLIHNFMDVSLRFVSSGIFLWLLAGLIGAMVLHDPLPENDAAKAAREEDQEPSTPAHPEVVLLIAQILTAGLFGAFLYMMLKQFKDIQGPFPDVFGDQLLWLIAWTSVLGTIAFVVWGIVKVARSMRYVYGFAILWAMLPALFVFWGYFMADAYHNRGIFYSKQTNWEMALESYRKVVKLNPNYMMAYYFMGNVYTDRWHPGDVDLAMQEYQHVWNLAPNYVQSHHQAGLVFLKKGQESRQQFDQYRSQHNDSAAIAALVETKKDWQQAIQYFEKYHAIDPVYEPNYARLGYVHSQLAEIAAIQGNRAEANRQFDAAEAAYEESLGAWVCGSPDNDVMHEHWSQNHRHFSAEMFENLGNVRFARGNLDGAARAYRMSLWVGPPSVRTLKNLSAVYSKLGRQADFFKTWNQLRQLAPTDPDVKKLFNGNSTPPQRT